jgi:hypothetical protein
LVPDHAPEALQEVALVDDQVSVEEPPLTSEVGFAASDTVGAAGVTVTLADALALPPGPVQTMAKEPELVNAPLDSLPEVALPPDQAPDAVQELASVDDQLRVEDPPLTTKVGFAVSDTVGIAGGGVLTVTVVDALALPPEPVQRSSKVLVLVNALLGWLPEVALPPDHAPEAVQEAALVDDQVSVDDPPLTTVVGFAASDTVGAGGVTVTVTEAFAVPPSPVQAMAKVPELVSTPLDWLPEIALVPDHAPEAVQELASVDDQVRVEDPPLTTEAGFAASDTVGTGAVTVTPADALALPPGPVQAIVKALELVSTPLDWLPEIALVPDHAPEALQEVALVDDQVSVDDAPLATEVGFAASDTVGAGGVTVTLADALALPPGPVQVREKLLLAVSMAVACCPEIALLPDQAPDAVQELASVDDQVSVEEPPLTTEVGFAASDTVGAGGVTVTPADALALPPGPVQVREKLLLAVSMAVACCPEIALLPDQAPDAVQELASVDDQVSVDDPPLTTEAGFAVSDTVGARGVTVTVADAFAVPPNPVQAMANVPELVSAPLGWLPEVALLPDHAPEAVQEVALVDDQVSVADPPLTTELGFAVSDTVGTGAVTVTLADALAVPPGPVQAMAKVLEAVSAPLDWLPEVALLPDHAPEAVQEPASVDDQASVDDPPMTTEAGFAHSDTVGSGGGGGAPVTLTVVDALELPPGPVQVREKFVLAASLAVTWLPEIGLPPCHPPEAEQELAFAEVQTSVAASPLVTEGGLATSNTVGAGGGGSEPTELAGVHCGCSPPPQAASARARSETSSKLGVRKMGIPIFRAAVPDSACASIKPRRPAQQKSPLVAILRQKDHRCRIGLAPPKSRQSHVPRPDAHPAQGTESPAAPAISGRASSWPLPFDLPTDSTGPAAQCPPTQDGVPFRTCPRCRWAWGRDSGTRYSRRRQSSRAVSSLRSGCPRATGWSSRPESRAGFR